MSPLGRPERRALELLEKFQIQQPPVPVDSIAEKLDVYLSYRPFQGNISGMLFRDAKKKVIGVNSRHPRTRQRFTIGHELGHFLLHRGSPLIIDRDLRINRRDDISSLALDTEEIEANRFAAELLMPRHLILDEFHDHARAGITSNQIVRQLARLFDVSNQAMEFRLTNLGIR